MSARVKAVLSADSVVLVDKTTKQERPLLLAYVSAPRLTEPWGFDAREFLRKLLLAKPVSVDVLYSANSRDYADLGSPVFKSLVEHVLEQGWAKLRDDAETKPGYARYGTRLVEAQQRAQARGAGIWTDRKWATLNVRSSVPDSVYGSGRQVPAIVERVISGDRVLLRAMFDPDDHFVGHALLGGIRTHRTQSGAPPASGASASAAGSAAVSSGPATNQSTGDAFGDAAAEAVSSRLLQRSQVRALFLAPSPSNPDLPLVTLLHPQGDIALVLVSSGLAEVPNVPQIGAERLLQLRNAQSDARTKGLGLYRAEAEVRKQHKETFGAQASQATVIKVISSDTVVLDTDNKVVQLSSTRAPRRGEDPELASAAKEFARKLLIGQLVRVQVDGETSFPGSSEPPRTVATLSFGPQFARNAALEIIRAGWATALHHRRDDLSRSPFYDELAAAETAAQEAKRGIFAPPKKNKGAPGSTVDASESVVRARGYLTSLERRQNIPAVVDNVISAGRLRLNVPSENCTLVVVLDGVRLPRAGEPHADETLSYVVHDWNQRDVQFSVRSVDKTGAFVSSVSRNSKSLAIELLSRGLASIHEGSANASGLRNDYEEVQAKARSARLGLWKDYEDPVESVDTQTSGLGLDDEQAASQKYVDAVISAVSVDGLHIRLAPADVTFRKLKSDMTQFFNAAVNSGARAFAQKPRRRDLVAVANRLERGRILSVVGSGSYEVELIDSGSVLSLKLSDIYPLPAQFAASPPLARPISLQHVHRPPKSYAKPYLEYLERFIGQPVVVIGSVVYTADSANAHDSLNYRLVAGGYASVPIAEAKLESAQVLEAAQTEAKAQRKGMWEFGDPRDYDDL